VSPPNQTRSISSFWFACFKAAALCILTGGALRQIAIQTQTPAIDEVANAILFMPCAVASVWVAWSLTARSRSSWLGAGMLTCLLGTCCLARFRIAAYPMLETAPSISGYCSPITFWLGLQCIHWLGFFVIATAIAKILQWTTGIGIGPVDSNHPNPSALSIAKLGLLITCCALITAAYQQWFLRILPGIIRTNDSPAWYQFFPIGSRPWVAGWIGGLLLPFHWLAIAAILGIKPLLLQQVLIGAWLLAATALQIACSKLYFSNLILPDDLSRWFEYSIGQPYIVAAIYVADEPPVGFYLFKALVQFCLVLVAIRWIRSFGLRIAFYPSAIN
jgi:hypothetical protein